MKNCAQGTWRRRWFITIAALAALLLLLSACGGEKGADAPEDEDILDLKDVMLEPAELIIFSIVPSITHEGFARTIQAPVQEKYPHYKLEYMLSSEVNLENLIVSGTVPDIMLTSLQGMANSYIRYDMQYDLRPLIEKYQFDLSRMEPATIESMQNATPNREIYGLPKELNGVVMFYNKDLFEQFGVNHPQDGMTWDDTYALARQMTRTFDSRQYRGMSFFFNNVFTNNQLSLPFVEPNRDAAAVNVPGFQKIFETLKRFYDIEGNRPEGTLSADNELNNFHRERNIAMVVSPMSGFGRFESAPDLNWDMTSAPTFADAPDIGFQANTLYYLISSNKHAEQAFQVVARLLDDDVQLMTNKEGRATSLANDAIRATLGIEHPIFSDKNFAAFFHNQFAPTPTPNPEVEALVNVNNMLFAEFREMINQRTDAVSALRVAEEKINQAIVAARAK